MRVASELAHYEHRNTQLIPEARKALFKSCVVVVTGKPGQGKTVFARQLMPRAAVIDGANASIEQPIFDDHALSHGAVLDEIAWLPSDVVASWLNKGRHIETHVVVVADSIADLARATTNDYHDLAVVDLDSERVAESLSARLPNAEPTTPVPPRKANQSRIERFLSFLRATRRGLR